MCFTIEIKLTREAIENRFKVETDILEDFKFQSYYRAFEQPKLPVVTIEDPDEISLMEWGLIPGWVTTPEQAEQIRRGSYNARAESAYIKSSFKKAFHQQRCLIIAHGFFEWQHRGAQKIPWYVYRKDDQPFAFAGLYDTWKNPLTGKLNNTVSIITTRANPLMEKIHNSKKRMPVVLTKENEADWISQDNDVTSLRELLVPINEKVLAAHTIGQGISTGQADRNNRNILEKVDYPEQTSLF